MQEKPSFIDDEQEHDDSLKLLSSLAQRQLNLEAEMKEVEERLDVLKKAHNKIAGEEIPNLLKNRGLSSIKLVTGEKIDVKEDVNVTVKDDNQFFEFLRSRNEDDIIKMMFTMDRMKTEKLDILFEFLNANKYDFEFDVNVHPNTKKKYFKDLIGLSETDYDKRLEGYRSGKLIPISELPNWCSVFIIYKTKIK